MESLGVGQPGALLGQFHKLAGLKGGPVQFLALKVQQREFALAALALRVEHGQAAAQIADGFGQRLVLVACRLQVAKRVE